MRHMVKRLIRKGGRVKIAGKWYQADTGWVGRILYDGRLDSLRAWFSMPYLQSVAYEYTDGFEFENDPRWVDGVFQWQVWKEQQ